MTRDVTVIGGIHPFSGFISSLGILLWCATASICFFTATILYSRRLNTFFWFLLFTALLSTYLLFDDLFLFHEFVESWNIGEELVYIVLGIAIVTYLIVFRTIILKTKFLMLLLALCLLAASVIIDTIQPYFWQKGDVHAFLEDGTKWLGIVSWYSYHINTSYMCIAYKIEKT